MNSIEWFLSELEKVNYHPTEAMIMYANKLHKQEIIDAKNDPKNYDAYWDNDVLISSGEVYYNETYV